MTSQTSEAGAWLDRALGAAAAILLFCLMTLTTADVISRYIFNWPLRGAFEITEASPELIKGVQERAKAIEEKWVQSATAKGVDGAKVLAEFREEVKRVATGN